MAAETFQVVLLGEGGAVDYTPSGDIAAGDVDILNGSFRFATQPILTSALGSVKAGHAPLRIRIVKLTGTLTVGTAMYWDDNGNPVGGTVGTGCATSTVSTNIFIGRVVKAVTSASTQTVEVDMAIPVTTGDDLTSAIADPGDTNAISVASSGYVPIVTAGAETNTLAAPSFVGQRLLLYCKTFVGNRVITCATTVNEAGHDTITFTATGQAVLLVAVEEGSTLRWRLSAKDGATVA